tara:strand:- start:82 stop:480 length:399 start_codon:yes stop_codon:yes gene_type:complete
MKDGEHEAKLFNDMKHIVTYKNGKKNGKETYWYPLGQKASECFYVDDKLEGELTAWTEFGQVIQVDSYKNDLLHGKCSVWNEKGHLESEMMMKEGRPFGKYTFYEDGVKVKEGFAEYPKNDSPYNFDGETVN